MPAGSGQDPPLQVGTCITVLDGLNSRRDGPAEWHPYKVRSRLAIPWRLQNYPFAPC